MAGSGPCQAPNPMSPWVSGGSAQSRNNPAVTCQSSMVAKMHKDELKPRMSKPPLYLPI